MWPFQFEGETEPGEPVDEVAELEPVEPVVPVEPIVPAEPLVPAPTRTRVSGPPRSGIPPKVN